MQRTNRNNDGRAFQEQILAVCAQYQSRGSLRVRKVDMPVRLAGKRVIFMKNPFLDFVGVWPERRGRAVMIEAKSTGEPKLKFNVESGGITTDQMDSLRNWHACGAAVFVLWEWKGHGVSLITWPVLALNEITNREGRGFKYLPWLPDAMLKQGRGFVFFDILERMNSLWPG